MNVSGFTIWNNNVSLSSLLNVSGNSTLRSITLKKDVDPSGDSLNFWYNTPGTYFTDNGFHHTLV